MVQAISPRRLRQLAELNALATQRAAMLADEEYPRIAQRKLDKYLRIVVDSLVGTVCTEEREAQKRRTANLPIAGGQTGHVSGLGESTDLAA